MKIFYALSTILLLAFTEAKSQDRSPVPDRKEPSAKIVKFYPNPATSYITFDLQQGDNQTYNLQIYNFIGKKVQEVTKVTPKTTVNLNDFYRGMYIFQLKDKSGKVVDSGKFQVSK
jgi:hypothetical protein